MVDNIDIKRCENRKMDGFYSHDQNTNVENEGHRKIDAYLHTQHRDDHLKLFTFWQNWKLRTKETHGIRAQNLILHQK